MNFSKSKKKNTRTLVHTRLFHGKLSLRLARKVVCVCHIQKGIKLCESSPYSILLFNRIMCEMCESTMCIFLYWHFRTLMRCMFFNKVSAPQICIQRSSVVFDRFYGGTFAVGFIHQELFEFGQRLVLNLAHTFAGQSQLVANLLQ